MKVLVMNCSPVRNGATAEIVNIVTARLEKKHDVKNICIDDYDIKFCKGCRTCHNTAKCVQNDDADRIIEQYELADIVISVSPSYWADIPGQFKSFIDRCTPWCNTHEPHAKISSGNILNVACTRAKYRIAFIGNINDWKNRRYFREFIPNLIDIINV